MRNPGRGRRRSPEMLALQRRQLDARLKKLPPIDSPRGGWIRAIREALGMTRAQLARRLGVTPQSLLGFEDREGKETITIAKLRQAAEAMECELRIAFVPRSSLEGTVRRQAAVKARLERRRFLHTMRLEDQSAGVAEILDEERSADRWIERHGRRLWD
jgi:predicted DNA-binding mobile mystery protein A